MMRIDVWLWLVCVYKFWLLVIVVVKGGYICFNGDLVKFFYDVKFGDIVIIYIFGWDWVFKVVNLIMKRVGVKFVVEVYEDLLVF